MGVNAMSMLAGTTSTDSGVSRVLQLLNMVTPDELMDNDDYEGALPSCAHLRRAFLLTGYLEIRDDVQEECEKFGTILALKIPRPVGGSRQSAGVGKIYIKFETPEFATKALRALAGRKFADRTVVTTYFPEVSSCALSRFSGPAMLTLQQENFDVNAW
jgi:splicing factor U2AF subunit